MNAIRSAFHSVMLAALAASLVAVASCAPTANASKTNTGAAPTFLLAKDGKALSKIIVGTAASKSSRDSAETLAKFLQRITGAAFSIEAGDGTRGIAIGMASEFPKLAEADALLQDRQVHPLAAKQRYRLRSHANGLQLIGASELATEYAVWDFLHRLGFRQYFPGAAWEIVPRVPSPSIAVNVLEEPDYYDRRISTIAMDDEIAEWTMRNRLSWHDGPPSFTFRPNLPRRFLRSWINTSHAYSYIVRDHKEEFDKHPEWLALVDGKRGPGTFLCISNPELRAFVAKWAVKHLEQYPDAVSVSLEPTDGARPCECGACAALSQGRVSNLVILLANDAAKAIEARFPNEPKYVGLLGYGYHWQPPTISVHDRVVVQITEKTLMPGLSPEPPMQERLAGWAEKAKHVGAYEYLSLYDWGGWLPATSVATNPEYLTNIVPQYNRSGARTWLAEASESWGSSGLGYYLTSRMLWDVNEGRHKDQIVEEFLSKSFGAVKEPMREFFATADGRNRVSPGNFNQLLARVNKMYPPLLRALHEANDPAVRTRIEQLLLYTRFVDMYAQHARLQKKKELEIEGATEADVRRSAVNLVRHAYQMQSTHLIPYYLLSLSWFNTYKLQQAELAAPGENKPRQYTSADIKRLVDEVTLRYAVALSVKTHGGRGPTLRHNNTVIFDARGFDGLTATRDGIEGADPAKALPGVLSNNATRSQDARIIQSPAGIDKPGPAAGDGYLRLYRGAGNTEANVQVRFEPRVDGRITVEWMAHGDPRGDGDNAMHYFLGQGNTERVGLLTRITGNVFYYRDGKYVDTGLHYNSAYWQRWQLVYEPETGLFDLTIGDETRKGLQGKAGPVDNYLFRCGQIETTFFVDGAS